MVGGGEGGIRRGRGGCGERREGEEGNIASPLKRSQSNFLHFGLATCWRSC